MNPLPSDRPGRKRITLSPEQLEDRTVPSGNVTAVVTRGMLEITGDAQGNQVWVNGLGHGQAVITPMGDTTVNGGHAPVVLGGIAFAYDTHLGAGDDFLLVTGTQGNIGLFVDMGGGHDGLAVMYASHTGPTVLDTGAGTDTVALGMDKFTGTTVVNTGAGNNQVVIGGAEFGPVLFTGGSGRNSMSLVGVNFHAKPLTVGFQSVGTSLPAAGGSHGGSTSPPPPVSPPPPASPPPPSANGPAPAITTTASKTTNLASIPFTVTFDKDVTGFTRTDVRVTNGAVSGFTAVNGHTYIFNVAPAIDGAVKVQVPAGAARDAAGNRSTSVSLTLTSDRTAPTATITAGASPSGQNTIPFTVTFSEGVTRFTADKVVVTDGTVSGFTAVSATKYTFNVAPLGSGLVQVALATGAATDGAGNGSVATQFSTLGDRTDAGMLPTTSSPPDPNDPNWQAMANGLKIWDVQSGSGPAVTAGSTTGVFYTGWLLNGTVFDSNHTAGSPAVFPLANLIQGWQQGIPGMQPGGIRRLYIPAALAYGSTGAGSVPPNSDLIFEIKLISVNA